MFCPNCKGNIPDGINFCPICGVTIAQPYSVLPQEEASRRAMVSMILGIVSLVTCGIPFIFAVILSILELRAIKKGKKSRLGYGYAIAGLILGIVSMFMFGFYMFIAGTAFMGGYWSATISRARGEQNKIAVGLEAYYAEHNTYPLPDEPRAEKPGSYEKDGTYASEGGIIPKILTTPIAYLTALPRDPFRLKGKGYYGFGSGPGPVNLIGTDNGKYLSDGGKPVLGTKGWIVTSYGPDKVDGNSGIKSGSVLREEIEWTDIDTTQPLYTKGLTYDPTNGTNSPGDLWRRGP